MNDDDDLILIDEPEDEPEDEPIIDIDGDGEFFGDSTESPTEFGSNITILSLDEGENLPIQSDQLTFISVMILIIILLQLTTSLLFFFSKMKRKKILIRYEKSNVPIYIE